MIKCICAIILLIGSSEAFPASEDQPASCTEIFSYQFQNGKYDGVFNLPESLKDEKLYKLQVEFTIPLKLQTIRTDNSSTLFSNMINEICMDKQTENKLNFTPNPSMSFNITSITYNDKKICSNRFNETEEFTIITFEQNVNEISDGPEDTNCQVDYETIENFEEPPIKYSTKPMVKKSLPLFAFFQWLRSSSTDSPLLKAARERVTYLPRTTKKSGAARAPPQIGGLQPGMPGGNLAIGALPGVANSNKNQMVQVTNIYVVNNGTEGQSVNFETINNSNYIYKVMTQIFNAFVGTPNFRRNQSTTKQPTATF